MLVAEPAGQVAFAPRVYLDEDTGEKVLYAVDKSCWPDEELLSLAHEYNCSSVRLIDLSRQTAGRELRV